MMWCIYYAGGARHDGLPEEAPERGVLAVLQGDPATGWYCMTGHDFYVWIGDMWRGVDHFGLWDYLCSPGWKRVLFGRMVRDDEYEEIHARALRDMGHKSAYRRGERQVH